MVNPINNGKPMPLHRHAGGRAHLALRNVAWMRPGLRLPELRRAELRRAGLRQGGFTLIEMLVVLAILALLLTIATPKVTHVLEKGNEAVLRQDLSQMREAIDHFAGDRNRYPDSLEELVAARYLKQIPVDPITGRNNTWVIISPDTEYAAGTVYDVRSGAPGRAADGSAYASW